MNNYAIVALIAVSPIGEELISIPTGWALEMPLWHVVAVSLLFNFLPVPAILSATGFMEGHPTIKRFVDFFRREKVMAITRKYGAWGVALLAPVTGVYATTVAAWALGMGKTKVMLCTMAGLAIYAAGCVLLIKLGSAVASIFS